MGTRAYRRNSRGRFAGASAGGTKITYGKAGGFANAAHRNRVLSTRANRAAKSGSRKSKAVAAKRGGGSKARPSRARTRPPTRTPARRSVRRGGAKGFVSRQAKKAITNPKVQVAVAGGVLAVGTRVAYNKINPGQTLKNSGLQVPGSVKTFGGPSAKRPDYTVVENKTHRFTTFSSKEGRFKKVQTTSIEKYSPKGKTTAPIGYIRSERGLTGGYKVTHTYLTSANRGKGLGKQALAAHAAHRPTRTYRASVDRSTMGQAFAKSVGGAGLRSSKSKAAGASITKTLDYDWRTTSKSTIGTSAKNIVANTKGMTPNKGIKYGGSKRLISGKRIRR